MNIKDLNKLPKKEIKDQLMTCCGSSKWAKLLTKEFPFKSETAFIQKAEDIWYDVCEVEDWLEAFSHHPQIGDVKSLEKKFAKTKNFTSKEQAKVKTASKSTLKKLAKQNKSYQAQNGFIFLVSAAGKSAPELLSLLNTRLNNSRSEELVVAVGEQHKITVNRLQKLLADSNWNKIKGCQLTTHVLDTASGKPAQGITIKLQRMYEGIWQTFTQGITNSDGRITDLLAPGVILEKEKYNMIFETEEYFYNKKQECFYPQVEVQFKVYDDSHYHIPLLLSPYGYTTYRGS